MQDKAGSGSGIPLAFFGITFAWAWGLWTIPLTTARGWIISPKLSGLRVLLLVGAYAPFVATFALSFRNGQQVCYSSAHFGGSFRYLCS